MSKPTPTEEAHRDTAQRWTGSISRALSGLIPHPTQAARDCRDDADATGATGDLLVAVCRSALSTHLSTRGGWLDGLYLDGFARGRVEGKRLVGLIRKDDEADGWDDWEPGDVETARDLLSGLDDGAVLRELLDEADITIKSISQNRLGDLARAIARNIELGESNRELAKVIESLLTSPAWADTIANTETTRVLTAGARSQYLDLGMTWIAFLSAEDAGVESLCQENEEQGPIPIWDQFVNGSPPVHPNCRCTIVPASGPDG